MNTTQTKLEPLVYSVADAAQALQVSRSTISELIHSRRLPSFTIGRRRLVTRVDLLEFVQQRWEPAS